jgi:hypothetical protein
MAHHADANQAGLFRPTPAAPTSAPVREAPAPRPRGKAPAMTPAVAHDVLAEVREGRYGLLDDTDRVVWFEDADHVRFATDADLLHSLMNNRYVEHCPARDLTSSRHGAITRPVLPLRLTKTGRELLARWSALAHYKP